MMSTQKTLYDTSWDSAVNQGRVDFGNTQANLDFLKKTDLIKPDKKYLEVGCGSGSIAAFLKAEGGTVIASDISQVAVDHASQRHPDIEFRAHPAEELPYESRSFDIVISFDVLEHIPDVDQHLMEVYRVLKPGGYYLFQTPNKLSNALFETLKCRSMAWKKYHPSLHFYGQLKRRLRRHHFSFQCIKINTMNEFAVNKFKKIKWPSWTISWINFRYLPFRLQTNFYIVAQRMSPNHSENVLP